MTHRIQIIGDELMGVSGEAATLFSELLLCEYPARPIQFAISTSVRYPLATVISRAPGDIFGKLAERIVLGLGLHEFRQVADAEKVFSTYKILVDEILSKTTSVLYLLTIPAQALPECGTQVQLFNEKVRGLDDGNRVHILDFALHVDRFEQDQLQRGKFARSLFDSNHIPTSLCNTLLGLFIEKRIFNTKKESENGF
ncbi:MAG: hypothetical protein VZR14_09250 [Hallerella sp.]|nr:hypothetical protein [Hallerella sp.]